MILSPKGCAVISTTDEMEIVILEGGDVTEPQTFIIDMSCLPPIVLVIMKSGSVD